jgi:hypothetical protein
MDMRLAPLAPRLAPLNVARSILAVRLCRLTLRTAVGAMASIDADQMNQLYFEARSLASSVEESCLALEEAGHGAAEKEKEAASIKLNQLSTLVSRLEKHFAASSSLGAMWKQ